MVLESLVNPIVAEEKRYRVLWLGFAFSIIAAFVTYILAGPNTGIDPSIILVTFTAIPAIPLIYGIIKYEEKKDMQLKTEYAILKQHAKALGAFMYLFIGMVLGYTLIFVVTPTDFSYQVFDSQITTLRNIVASAPTGMASESGQNLLLFNHIFFNNLKVLMLAIIFSFLFGAGAIFILAWNASVIGTAIGVFINNGLLEIAETTGFSKAFGYFEVISIGLLMFTIHGIPEIAAYFVAALAGGIISIAVINHHYTSEKFEKIVLDSADLILISIGLLFIAAILEVYVTPLIF